MNNDEIAKIFKALCDENRVTIIKLLQSGEKCACDISEQLSLSQSKLSYHMKILCASEIVECRYEGKWTYYKINIEGSKQAIGLLESITEVGVIETACACSENAI